MICRKPIVISLRVTGLVLFVLSFISCRKEYVDKINTIAGDTMYISGMNYIKSFEVKEYSPDTILKAGITTDTIVVYWPSYSRPLPDSIAPIITLPDSAIVSPASGKRVAFKTGITYTVTSAAGASKKYTLKVNQQSPVPWFYYNPASITLGDVITLAGDQFWQDTSQTKVYLVSARSGIAYQAELFSVAITGPRFIVPLNVPTDGLYDIKVVNGAYTVYNATEAKRNAISLVYPTVVNLNAAGLPSKLSRGNTFTVRGTLLSNVVSASLYANGVYTPVDVVSAAVDKVLLGVPAGMPLGTYTRLRVVTADGITKALAGIAITVSE
jgi:hypothetical protein